MNRKQTQPFPRELQRAEEYFKTHIENADRPNFDFTIGGEDLPVGAAVTELESNAEKRTIEKRWTAGAVEVRQVATLYRELPAVEWTVYVKNISGAVSERVRLSALNDRFPASSVVVHAQKGSYCAADDFRPVDLPMRPGDQAKLAPIGGRSSNMTWPYFCIETGENGLALAVGWPAQWQAVFACEDEDLHVQCGQQTLETVLYGRDSGAAGIDRTGEQIRSPRIVLLFWDRGDLRAAEACMRARNLFRRYMLRYNMPRGEDGKPPVKNLAACSSHQFREMLEATTRNQKQFIDGYVDHNLGLDYWWMDAGWYKTLGGGWVDTGNWQPDPERFGDSLKPISDMCHENGLKLILWYEPERVCPYTEFYELRDKGYIIEDKGWHLYNLANDEAFEYLCEYMVQEIRDNGVDVYRQDCNIADLQMYWELNEAEDRRGITENKYIVNYLAYFDYLMEQCPGLLIDSCASGGRRMDLETQKRSVVLWRDDSCYEPTLTQCQSFGINFFNPFSGQATTEADPELMTYVTRSNFMQSTNFCYNIESGDQDLIDRVKKSMDEYRAYSPYFLCDYYPLTTFSDRAEDWMAWQYHDADDNSGIVQVFKREGSADTAGKYYLSGLEKGATYIVKDIDTGESYEAKGRDLMVEGMDVEIQDAFAAKIFHYTAK